MPKVSDILRTMEFKRAWGLEDSGACFGVTDPSRLRPVSPYPTIEPRHLCHSCLVGEHLCTNKAISFVMVYNRDDHTKDSVERNIVACECKKCHPTLEQVQRMEEERIAAWMAEDIPPF